MEEAADLQDWELLSPRSGEDAKTFEGLGGADDSYGGAIESDYFALDSEKRRTEKVSSEEESEEGGVDSDNPSWVDPDSDPRHLERSRVRVEFRGSGFPIKSSCGFWSDVSSDCQSSPAVSEKGEFGNRGDPVVKVGVEGIKTGYQDSSDDDGEKALDFGRRRDDEEIETGLEAHRVEESGELVKMGDGSGSLESVSSSEGEKRGVVWWKMSLEFIKFYVFKMRPFWSISIAAALMGLVMLGRKLYKMKHKSQRIQLKIAFDDKVRFPFVLVLII